MTDTTVEHEHDTAAGHQPDQDSFQDIINQKSNMELAKRTVASYAILLIYVIFVSITPYFKDHAAAVTILGAVIAASLAVRIVIARRISSVKTSSQAAWLRNYSLASLAVSLAWSGFVCTTYYFYQVNWIMFLLTISTIGIAAASTSSMSPNALLARVYSIIMVLPFVVIGFLEKTRPSITLAVMLIIFIAALLVMIKDNHHLYRNSLVTIEKLNFQKAGLENIFARVMENSGRLKDASSNLSDISGKMSDSAGNMSAKSSSVSSSVDELKNNSKTTSDAMAQLRENADRLATLTGEMTQSIHEISDNTQKTDSIAQEAVSQARSITENVNQLGESARQVGNISDTIEEISSQTNLLALNATIEAARAGEAGKGFAVVANEIKTLANQTAEATQQIKDQINAIQTAISQTVSEISRISKITTEIGESTASSAASVEEQAGMAKTISNGVSEASAAIATISDHASRTLATTDRIAENIDMVNLAVSEVVGHSMNVEESAQALRKQANELNDVMTAVRTE